MERPGSLFYKTTLKDSEKPYNISLSVSRFGSRFEPITSRRRVRIVIRFRLKELTFAPLAEELLLFYGIEGSSQCP
jgi:hypothetical protein